MTSPPAAFAWDATLVATLRHSTLAWEEPLAAVPFAEARDLGARDRLSLLAQFAAHQALLQFAGVADDEVSIEEWCVVRQRGSDIRLIRIAARACDPSTSPAPLTLAQQFAEQVGAELDILRQPWARADAVYAEAFARLTRDAAADLRWMRRAAAGAIVAPGPEGLRTLVMNEARYACSDEESIDAVQRFAKIDRAFQVLVLRGVSPLERYSALGAFGGNCAADAATVAEHILASTYGERHLFIIADDEAFDEGSRQVVELLAHAQHGTWLLPRGEIALPPTRPFIIAPRLDARAALRSAYGTFVESDAFETYLAHGDVPSPTALSPTLTEPVRSYVGALALLGATIAAERASHFLAAFLFRGTLEELVVDGVTSFDGVMFTFTSEAARAEAARLIPTASRTAICRAAAPHASGVEAALLWLDAGDAPAASAALEATTWRNAEETVAALRRVPEVLLTDSLAARYAHALIDCGRYRDARDLGVGDELLLARAERRTGDYATALARLERIEPSFEATLLRAEVLRLLGRNDEAAHLLATCSASTDEERVWLDYERALHGTDITLPPTHYLEARRATYRALEREAYDDASQFALEAHRRARTLIERIDASLDRLFAVFSAGDWDRARAIAVEALQEVEETQGDRAAGGILFTLSFLAADDGQWAHAAQRIAGLRRYYASTGDAMRLEEVQLLNAQLDFSRGRFIEARRTAESVYCRRPHHDQIREAAALILDELDWMNGTSGALRSTGKARNVELRRRHETIAHSVALAAAGEWPSVDEQPKTMPSRLRAFRIAIATNDQRTARKIASACDLLLECAPDPADAELRILRTAATRDYPFASDDFDLLWCFATRNRLGNWNAVGSYPATQELLDGTHGADWIACGERELLYVDGSAAWSVEGREAIGALFRTRAENHRLRRLLEQEENVRPVRSAAIDGIVGQSSAVREIEAIVARVARRDVAVCILGESGTGKELVARAIHRQSARRQKGFTPLNCAALPETLVESELFGHVRGAFTGADRDRPGLIETTDGGTLFLDEIGELPLATQAKLLRFLQEGEFRRVGDTANRSADVRIVSATNRKLDSAVEQGRFRDDLYYRVRGVEIALPPLRERGGDILLLVSHFLAAEREKHRSGPAALSPDAEAIFAAYQWPGNVRELQNTIRAAHAMAGEAKEIEVEHLPERLRSVVPLRAALGSYQDSVTRFKRDLIERSLLQAGGNQNKAATMLKISRQALAYQIRELGILVRP